ncbi:oligomeric complex COG6 [Ascobolus immersus RN42]|uniref:Conserved oligomeric Golgi complex subunit 6 n=1 Tax=Ascobolus immersus RN42 TaxID=1160509 RepID=A0A3N4HU88_ASCIM|nr:oligomeric complex COG6 [Ascobolus immersus RN42]
MASDALQRKVSTLLSTSYTDASLAQAITILDTRFSNSEEARKRLQQDVQKDLIESDGQIILEFSKIADQLAQIGESISAMNSACTAMRTSVNAANKDIGPVISEAETLIKQKSDVEKKSAVLEAFKKQFVVPEEDLATLTSPADVDDRFFEALAKVKAVHADAKVLIVGDNHRAGMEVMDQCTKALNTAFQKLYKWIQKEFKSIALDDPRVAYGIRRALRVLSERPNLFQSCLDFFAESRQKVVVASFYDALTGSTTGGKTSATGSKPIELYAHDPLRYVGDMFAWLHSTILSEREALEILFISDEDDEFIMENGNPASKLANIQLWGKGFDANKALMTLVDKDLVSVCKPLKLRIEQVIASHDENTLAYKLHNLINFYRLTLAKFLATDSTVIATVQNLEKSALTRFEDVLRTHIKFISNSGQAVPEDLSPPEFLTTALGELKVLMTSYDTSLVPTGEREEDFGKILNVALDPYLEIVDKMGAEVKVPGRHIFSLNSFIAAKTVLEEFNFTEQRVGRIVEYIRNHGGYLITYIHTFFLLNSGLKPLLAALDSWDKESDTPLSSLPPFTPSTLSSTATKLDSFLPSAIMDAQSLLRQLQSPQLASAVVREAAEAFVEDFERVEEAIMVDKSFELGREVWPRTGEEARLLLALDS